MCSAGREQGCRHEPPCLSKLCPAWSSELLRWGWQGGCPAQSLPAAMESGQALQHPWASLLPSPRRFWEASPEQELPLAAALAGALSKHPPGHRTWQSRVTPQPVTLEHKSLPHTALALLLPQCKRWELIPALAGAPSGNSAVFGFWDEQQSSFTLMDMGLHYTAYITGCHAGASRDVDCAHLHKSKNK